MKLRDYQQRTIDIIRDRLRSGIKRLIVTLPTGSGKSIIMGAIAKMCTDKGNKVLALMHRRQLVDQLSDRFEDCGVGSGIVMAGIDAELSNKVQIGTIQTYARRIGFEEYDWATGDASRPWEHDASLVLVDECHRSLSKKFQDTLKIYHDKIVIGFTATPALSTGVSMGHYYQDLIQPVTVKELINCGALVPGVYYGLNAPDLKGIKIIAGDYEKRELDSRTNTPKIVGDIVLNWSRIAAGKKTIVFAVNVKHSKAIVHEFLRHDIPAEHLDAHSPDDKRAETISRFVSGETKIISNVGLYTEGTDIPSIECICLARPTKSLGLYIQMVGRGARPSEGKHNFTILDHGKNINEHGFYEDDIQWVLDGKELTYCKNEKRPPHEKHKMQCKICNAVFVGDTCPVCYTKIENYGKKIEAIEYELKELKNTREQKGLKTYPPNVLIGMLKYEANRLGKSDSWIRANYRSLTERWPKNLDVTPIPANQDVKNMLQYFRIKYIKSHPYKNNYAKT
jgi:superfamily II DNA or RNA helicase